MNSEETIAYTSKRCLVCNARIFKSNLYNSQTGDFCSDECEKKRNSNIKITNDIANYLQDLQERQAEFIRETFGIEDLELRFSFNYKDKASDMEQYIGAMSEITEISISELKGKSRKREIVQPRHVIIFTVLEHQLLNYSLKQVGEAFGGRDHSTIIHAKDNVRELLEINDKGMKSLYLKYCEYLMIEPKNFN